MRPFIDTSCPLVLVIPLILGIFVNGSDLRLTKVGPLNLRNGVVFQFVLIGVGGIEAEAFARRSSAGPACPLLS